jgi:hypothetical protein
VGRFQIDAAVPMPSLRPRGNLPAQLTTFVGRDRELSSLFDLVTANRLVTVTGAGGTGKTRLVLRLAEELQPDIPQGVWLCDLASVAEASLVGDAVALALGANRAAPDRLAAARDLLRERSVLLVLDNCEHLLPASGAAALDLLAACPGVRIVATSRTPLGVIGESVFALQPLAPDDAIVQRLHRPFSVSMRRTQMPWRPSAAAWIGSRLRSSSWFRAFGSRAPINWRPPFSTPPGRSVLLKGTVAFALSLTGATSC